LLSTCRNGQGVDPDRAFRRSLPRLVPDLEDDSRPRLGSACPEPRLQRPVAIAQIAALGHFVATSEERRAPVATPVTAWPGNTDAVADRQVKRLAEPTRHEAAVAIKDGLRQPANSRLQTEIHLVGPRVRQRDIAIGSLVEKPEGNGVFIDPARRSGGSPACTYHAKKQHHPRQRFLHRLPPITR